MEDFILLSSQILKDIAISIYGSIVSNVYVIGESLEECQRYKERLENWNKNAKTIRFDHHDIVIEFINGNKVLHGQHRNYISKWQEDESESFQNESLISNNVSTIRNTNLPLSELIIKHDGSYFENSRSTRRKSERKPKNKIKKLG